MSDPRTNQMRAMARAVLLVAITLVGACSSSSTTSTGGADVAMTVNGVGLGHGDLNDRVQAIGADPVYLARAFGGGPGGTVATAAGRGGNDLVQRVLGQQVSFVLVHQEVERRHLTVSPAARTRAEQLLVGQLSKAPLGASGQQVAGDSAGQKALDDLGPIKAVMVDGLADVVVLQADMVRELSTDAALRAAFDGDPASYQNQACVSLIAFFANKDSQTGEGKPATDAQYPLAASRAEDVRARLAAGGDFGTLAKARSDDDTTGPQGGDLGCQPLGAYRKKQPEIDDVITTSPVGEVVGPVKTGFGYALVLVRSRGALTFDQARPQLLSGAQTAMGKVFSAWLSQAMKDATVVVDPQYGTWDGNLGAVAPPGTEPATTTAP
jgi:hypothetical protein